MHRINKLVGVENSVDKKFSTLIIDSMFQKFSVMNVKYWKSAHIIYSMWFEYIADDCVYIAEILWIYKRWIVNIKIKGSL